MLVFGLRSEAGDNANMFSSVQDTLGQIGFGGRGNHSLEQVEGMTCIDGVNCAVD